MAETNKTTSRKSRTNAKKASSRGTAKSKVKKEETVVEVSDKNTEEELVVETSNSEVTKEENKQIKESLIKAEPKKFEDGEEIPVLSIFPGTVVMVGRRSQNVYQWDGMGTIEYVEYQDLKAEAINNKSSYLYDPLLIIQSQEFVENYENLVKLYANTYNDEELISIIKNSSATELKEIIQKLPIGLKNAVKTIVATMMQDGTMDSLSKIRVVDEIFGTEMIKQAEMFL